MPEYRRMIAPGGTFFITIVTHERAPLFQTPDAVALLRRVVAEVRDERPFTLLGAVILPDHLHWLIELPAGDTDFSTRVGRIKALFTKRWDRNSECMTLNASRQTHRERGVWQRRFWEHMIRDERDFEAHMDYIHYNPVKHGLAPCPHTWPYSSFQRCVQSGHYEQTWCCVCDGRAVRMPESVQAVRVAGE